MFLRTVKVKREDGHIDEYVRLVESVWRKGRPEHRVISNLGRKDLLAPHADTLRRMLTGEHTPRPQADAVGAWDWGPLLVARHLWRELGLEQTLDAWARDRGAVADRALALVASRLDTPTSEHGMARWLETAYVCDRSGQRWLPAWRQDAERLASHRPRVRVQDRQLRQWYSTLDRLVKAKPQIEQALFLRLRTLFALNVDLVFYDLTSTYFEGTGPADLAKHGHSRDGKPRNRQVLVGVVMIDGWPIAHHVFEGHRRDASTVKEVLGDLEARFGLRRVVFVGDRGMVTVPNVELLRSRGQGYVVGLNRRRRPMVRTYIERATGPWLECPMGVAARERSTPPKTLVQEVAADRPDVRVFVVHSEEREAYERAEREKAMQRVRTALEALEQRVAAGKLKAPEKIGAAAARILARSHGYRYYTWSLKDRTFQFVEHPVHLAQERALEGKYLIQTEEPTLSPVDAVTIYKDLSEVERAFAELKDVIEMRPIYHYTADRVRAHIFVASLAFLLDRALEKTLKASGLDISSKEAWHLLKTVRVVEIDLGDGQRKRSVTHGSARAAHILKAIGITHLDPDAAATDPEKAA
ncbi:MAG: IS1634 family transposase [Acidobacteria bacterium]|nr:IS1634 family transposase [Acidobacteriota bacterium]